MPKGKANDPTLPQVIVNLTSRFLPVLDLTIEKPWIRVFFQLEQAHWFYIDHVRPLYPSLPEFYPEAFYRIFFKLSPLLESQFDSFDQLYKDYSSYRKYIPVGLIAILNEQLTRILLVKSYQGKRWMLPGGKVNEGESTIEAAVREGVEEVGVDLSSYIDPGIKLVSPPQHKIRPTDVYFAVRVPDRTEFHCKTRGEIDEIAWFPIEEVPLSRYILAFMPSIASLLTRLGETEVASALTRAIANISIGEQYQLVYKPTGKSVSGGKLGGANAQGHREGRSRERDASSVSHRSSNAKGDAPDRNRKRASVANETSSSSNRGSGGANRSGSNGTSSSAGLDRKESRNGKQDYEDAITMAYGKAMDFGADFEYSFSDSADSSVSASKSSRGKRRASTAIAGSGGSERSGIDLKNEVTFGTSLADEGRWTVKDMFDTNRNMTFGAVAPGVVLRGHALALAFDEGNRSPPPHPRAEPSTASVKSDAGRISLISAPPRAPSYGARNDATSSNVLEQTTVSNVGGPTSSKLFDFQSLLRNVGAAGSTISPAPTPSPAPPATAPPRPTSQPPTPPPSAFAALLASAQGLPGAGSSLNEKNQPAQIAASSAAGTRTQQAQPSLPPSVFSSQNAVIPTSKSRISVSIPVSALFASTGQAPPKLPNLLRPHSEPESSRVAPSGNTSINNIPTRLPKNALDGLADFRFNMDSIVSKLQSIMLLPPVR